MSAAADTMEKLADLGVISPAPAWTIFVAFATNWMPKISSGVNRGSVQIADVIGRAKNRLGDVAIGRVMKLLEDFFPLTREGLESADDDHIGHIDQFIYRVSKLQDSMGTRMLPALYAFLEETDSPIPFLDILHRLEQLEVLPSVHAGSDIGRRTVTSSRPEGAHCAGRYSVGTAPG